MYQPRGYFVLLIIVFSAVFLTLITALAGYIFVEKKVQLATEGREKAFDLAESGLEYYRWHLAHFATDLKDGTSGAGPYVHTLKDPEGGTVGTFSLNISGAMSCSALTDVTISATGAASAGPTYKRTLSSKYVRPSVADYSTIVNSNVWAGSDRVITGPYQSNGGVRMDATHNAQVYSGVATWTCTSDFGCGSNTAEPGVFGSGSNPGLWSYPAPTIDFNGITVDLATLKNFATSSGKYLPASGSYGWLLTMKSNGTFDAAKVTGTTQIWGYDTANGWLQERTIVSSTGAATNYAIPASCPIVFAEDNVWLQGVVSGKVTLAAANTGSGATRSIVIPGNITYAHATGDGLTAVGQQDVLISLQSPDTMEVHGIFIAQGGKFGRNYYTSSGGNAVPAGLASYVLRSHLTTVGTVVSNGRVGTKWTSGGTFVSGYANRTDTYDRALAESPPAFTPQTSTDYVFREWKEQ